MNMNPLSHSALRCAAIVLIANAAYARDFAVKLGNCTEFIGVASVARASLCRNASIDGSPNETVKVAQTGVVVIPPDGTGDINSYTLSYSTNSLRLAVRLELAGMNVSLDPDLVYEVTPDPPGAGGELFAETTPLTAPGWFLSGTVADPPPTPNFPFTANWWFQTRQGRLKMATAIPMLNYGSGNARVYTRRQSQLGELIGGNSGAFGTNLRGVFANAVLTVTFP